MGIVGKCAGVAIVAGLFFGCQSQHQQQAAAAPHSIPATRPAANPPAPALAGESSPFAPGVAPSDLRDALAELDKGHHDKMKLAWYVSSPFKSVAPSFRPFYQDMGKRQKELATELEEWAKKHHIDLTYRYGSDPMGQGQKIMEDASEKEARSADKEDFDRDMLVNMKQDYGWDASLDKALLQRVTDPGLKSYLEKASHVHEEGLVAINGLLRKYKFQG